MARLRVGRPPVFEAPEDMAPGIEAYFEERANAGMPFTVEGVCAALKICTQTFREYEAKDEFTGLIKQARNIIAESVLDVSLTKSNQAGAIFWLKNHGYTDRTEQDVTQAVSVNIDGDLAKSL